MESVKLGLSQLSQIRELFTHLMQYEDYEGSVYAQTREMDDYLANLELDLEYRKSQAKSRSFVDWLIDEGHVSSEMTIENDLSAHELDYLREKFDSLQL